MSACGKFVQQYKSTLDIVNGDTLKLSRITPPPDSINKFLKYCIEKKDFSPLKYAVVILMKQYDEYFQKFHGQVDGPVVSKNYNGFIEMISIKINLSKDKISLEYQKHSPLWVGEACHWAVSHKKEILDYDYVKRFKKSDAKKK